jgi:tRNA pseudouridine32 synthase / 23S rRNA pseudouridine746 synthase
MQVKIVYRDQWIIVVEKPGGLLSVPGRGPDKQDSVVTRIKSLCPNIIEQPSVHRLDMYTTGLMVLALTGDAHRSLSRQFEERKVLKKYMALLESTVNSDGGIIDMPFRLDIYNRPHQVYDPLHGKRGISNWHKIGDEDGRSRIEFHPTTGRTHQLRLHASHPLGLNSPIVGDSLYGGGKDGDPLLLHAFYLRFWHPNKEREVEFTSQIPF